MGFSPTHRRTVFGHEQEEKKKKTKLNGLAADNQLSIKEIVSRADDANIAGSAPGSRPRRLPQRSAGVEDEHCDAGINSGQQGKAGQVLALSSGCAVRDGVELLVLAAGDPVAKEAAKGRAKDAKD
jgi:hypothetical protein